MPALLVIALAVFLAACGGDDTSGVPDAQDVELGHVHGLGVNPKDGALFVATHHGLFRSAEGETRASLVGDLRQDTMGFTVVGSDQFLASGHPDTRTDAPPQLGLIRSRDGGRTWTAQALEGEADLHTIQSAGNRFYAHDAISNRLFEGRIGGSGLSLLKTPPGTLIDLAAEPGQPDHLVAVTDRGMFDSSDAGRSWRKRDGAPLGLIAFAPDGLALVDGAGRLHRQRGETWMGVGEIGGAPAALEADGETLYAAVQEGPVVISSDGGRNWSVRIEP